MEETRLFNILILFLCALRAAAGTLPPPAHSMPTCLMHA